MVSSNHHKTLRNNTGSILISLIITMVVLAALGAAMVSLTSTSMFGQVGAAGSARAYFLAESGYRYVESRYMNASSESAKDAELEAMHDKTFTLNNNAGKFNLKIYPYFLKIDPAVAAGTSTGQITTRIPGGVPADRSLSTGRLKIGTKAGNIYSYAEGTPSVIGGKSYVTFTGVTPQPFPYFPLNTDVLPVARSSSSSQTINEGGTLELGSSAEDKANAFPLRNGTFQVNGRVYAYKENDLANNRLLGITDPKVSPMSPLTVAENTDIILNKFVKLHSTGTYAEGSVEGSANREVEYHVPLSPDDEERREFTESFEDMSNWKSDPIGSFAIQSIGGDKALRVTGTQSLAGTPKAALIRFDPSALNIDLPSAHRYGNPYFLSYDAQVKIGFASTPYPQFGFDPSPIPLYYAAGLLFRLDNNNNTYGLSFLRGSNVTSPTPDNINDGIVPIDKKNLIVLWQLTNSGTQAKWLAYKDLNVFFFDDVEKGDYGWTATGLWHSSARKPYTNSPTRSWYYGREDTGNYNTGARTTGSLISPEISLCQAVSPVLTFWSWYRTEPDDPRTGINEANEYDKKYIDISANNFNNYTRYQLTVPGNPMGTWQQISVPLSSYSGQAVKIRFVFDSIDGVNNTDEGWYIDDIKVSGTSTFPLNEATLMVRVMEASSVTFINGGSVSIEDGDMVVGQTSGGRGTVSGTPILQSGSWAGNSAAGTLLLRNTTGTFSVGEQIKVIGSTATFKVTEYRIRDNFIRAYYGDKTGCGSTTNSPLDSQRGAMRRGTVFWPPDEIADWSATNDYFTLVQWDEIKSDLGENTVKLIGSIDEPKAIIRSNTLTSPTSGPLGKPELGLHAFGQGATNVYFDDFAVQADIGAPRNIGFVRTIQE